MLRRLLIGTLIVLIAARIVAGAQQSQLAQTTSPSHPSEALLLDAGDLLDLRVFDTPELSEKLRVDHGEIALRWAARKSARPHC